MVSYSSSPPPRGGKCRPQPDNHRTQALQRPNECRTLPGRRGACFPRAVAGGFERRLETVFAASYTKAVLTYGLTGCLARRWPRFDGDAYALPFMFHYPVSGPGWRGLPVKVCCLLLSPVNFCCPPRFACKNQYANCCFLLKNCCPARVSRTSKLRRPTGRRTAKNAPASVAARNKHWIGCLADAEWRADLRRRGNALCTHADERNGS